MIFQDITPILTANGFGIFGTDFFWSDMPPEPDDLLTFYESPGPAGIYAKDGRAVEEGRLQCLSRSESYETAMQKALDVYALLDDYRDQTYHIRALQRPFDVGAQDEAGRTIISANYALYI